MNQTHIVTAWGRIVQGFRPILSIEITNRCPLSCPGCYAYQPNHVTGTALELISEKTGDALVQGVLQLVEKERPMMVSVVGGEPLVRFRELSVLLPELGRRVMRVEVVTSAVRPIPEEWSRIKNLTVVVSVDGLQPEHDARRKPATYERILAHIEGIPIFVHLTVTGQMTRTPGYVEEFVRFWSARPEVVNIRVSLFTPQKGEARDEVLRPEDRERVVEELGHLIGKYPKLELTGRMLGAYRNPPRRADQCIFSQITSSIAPDLSTAILPCQFGGVPDCSQCGCAASIAFEAVGRASVAGIRLGTIFRVSHGIGRLMNRIRKAGRGVHPPAVEIEKRPETTEALKVRPEQGTPDL